MKAVEEGGGEGDKEGEQHLPPSLPPSLFAIAADETCLDLSLPG